MEVLNLRRHGIKKAKRHREFRAPGMKLRF
jgi:hypothetical protein